MDDQGWGNALGYVATALGGGGATALFNWLSQRSKDRSIARSAVQQAANELIETALGSARAQVERLQDEVEALRSEIADLKASHAEEIATLKASHADCEEGQRKLHAEIERLMSGEVPGYTSLKRPTTRRA